MSTPLVNLIVAGLVLALFQTVAAIPWVSAFDRRPFRQWITDPKVLAYLSGGTFGLGLLIAFFINSLGDVEDLTLYGRLYAIVLHAQLVQAFAILAPRALIRIAPKTGAVAVAAYSEALRQPMFWLILVVGKLLIVVSMVVPYFTLGDDYKLMKQVGFDAVMLFSALFGLLTASISVNEEIEGRTAITVISKPVSRRQFFMGKYLGILLACWVMTMALGVTLTWALWVKPRFDPLDDVIDPMPFEVTQWLQPKMEKLVPTTEGKAWAKGMGAWFGEAAAHHIGLARIFGQVMILLGICTALATRVQFIVNLVICFGVFLIGNLSPIMVHVTEKKEFEGNTAMQLVRFIAQAVNAVFPSLDAFDMGPAIIRDMPLSTITFLGFVGTVLLYALLYTGMTLLGGLVLFEDRDLA
jgi:ABC-type transport system involved in multi-copper enzyme maturation permease subunit